MGATHDNAGIAANMDVRTITGDFTSFGGCRDTYFNPPQRAIWRDGFAIHDLVIASNVYLRAINFDHQSGVPGAYAIILYGTEIVRYYSDGTFSVDNGGHNTVTTSRRVSQFTPTGYVAYHHRKRLQLNGHVTEHDVHFPVRREVS